MWESPDTGNKYTQVQKADVQKWTINRVKTKTYIGRKYFQIIHQIRGLY